MVGDLGRAQLVLVDRDLVDGAVEEAVVPAFGQPLTVSPPIRQ